MEKPKQSWNSFLGIVLSAGVTIFNQMYTEPCDICNTDIVPEVVFALSSVPFVNFCHITNHFKTLKLNSSSVSQLYQSMLDSFSHQWLTGLLAGGWMTWISLVHMSGDCEAFGWGGRGHWAHISHKQARLSFFTWQLNSKNSQQEGKPRCIGTFQSSICVMFSDVPLAKEVTWSSLESV